MDFKGVFERGCIAMNLTGRSKREVIEEMVDLLHRAGLVPNRDAALTAILEREQRMSTGMQNGVAIPHGKSSDVPDLVTAFGLKRDGVDFDSLDGEPARIFVMALSSPLDAARHIQFLSEIGKRLMRPSIRERLLAAETRDDVVRIMTE